MYFQVKFTFKINKYKNKWYENLFMLLWNGFNIEKSKMIEIINVGHHS
jgi:hypothetical protein